MNQHCFRQSHWAQLFPFLLATVAILGLPGRAAAQQALTWARIDFLRNQVQLIPQGRTARTARLADILGIGDALRTAPAARAELRFNDGSLARIGERATFRFTPNTRNFQLTNGTMLLLIPPGRGRTTIQTPNAVTGIQGSGLFTRYIPETNTTIVGALTNNPQGPMVVYNQSGTEQQSLYAHQMVVVEGDRISSLYNFDLELFYETSGLTEGLNLTDPAASTGSDALDGVRQEILDALEQQPPIEGEGVIENPDFITPPAVSSLQDEVGPVAAPLAEGNSASNSSVQEINSREPIVAPREANLIEPAIESQADSATAFPDAEATEVLEPAALPSDRETDIDAEFPDFEDSPADQFLEAEPDPAGLKPDAETPIADEAIDAEPEEVLPREVPPQEVLPEEDLPEEVLLERTAEPGEPVDPVDNDALSGPNLEPESIPAEPVPAADDIPEAAPEDVITVPESTTDPDSVSPVETGIPSETLTESPMPEEVMPPTDPVEPPPEELTPVPADEVVPNAAPTAPPDAAQTVPDLVDTPNPETESPMPDEVISPTDQIEPLPTELPSPSDSPPESPIEPAPNSDLPPVPADEVVPNAAPTAPPDATQTVPDLVDTPDPETLETLEETQPEQLPSEAAPADPQ